MKNPNTTALGIISIASALLSAASQYFTTGHVPDLGPLISAIVAGVGLIAAKDGNKPA